MPLRPHTTLLRVRGPQVRAGARRPMMRFAAIGGSR
jgi:hypothetical protein